MLAVASPQASAQMPGNFQPLSAPQKSVDPNSVVAKMMREGGTEQGPAQQPWRFTKGKDHDKLPAEFQWDTPPTPVNTA